MNKPESNPGAFRQAIEIAALALVYFLTAKLGQLLAIPPGNITPIWIPSGIILFAVLWRGSWIWPGIFIGAFLGNAWAYFDPSSVQSTVMTLLSGAMNGAGDTLCALVGARLIVLFCGSAYPFHSVKCVLNFLFFGAFLGSLISAVMGVSGLVLGGILERDAFATALTTWFVGDAVGIILLTPLCMAFLPGRGTAPGSSVEFIFLALLVVTFSVADFQRLPGTFEHVVWYFNLPVLLWAARRLSSRATYFLMVLAAATLHVWHFVSRDTSVGQDALNYALIEIQLFITVTTVTVLVVTALFRELMIARDQANDASRTKSQFLSNMSHEIRTPLNGVMGMLHLARQQTYDDTQKQYLDIAKNSADHLLAILNDVLDFSRIESGRIEFEDKPFTISALFERVESVIGFKAREKGIGLVFETGNECKAELRGDAMRIGQVLINLANNAVKFSEDGGSVVLRAMCDSDTVPERLLFSVADTGIGMTEEELMTVFSAFRQADASTTRKYGGSGLGLAISKQLVEAMGGRLWAESEKGKGSVFYFSIPLDHSGDRSA